MIHGGNLTFRRDILDVLERNCGQNIATRYALCGRGDRLTIREQRAGVSVRGCGHRMCPRCSRKRGAVYARRILQHIARSDHGFLYHTTLTQKVITGQSLVDTKTRFEGRLRTFLRRLKTNGMTSSMVSIHIVWSETSEGWHYHAHLFIDMAEQRRCDWFKWEWVAICEEDGEYVRQVKTRAIAVAGGPIEDLERDSGDADLWSEVGSKIGKAVQYPIRDMSQGVAMWKLGTESIGVKERAEEMVQSAKGWKVHRCWGKWREAAPDQPEKTTSKDDEEDEKTKIVAGPNGVDDCSLGTMDRCYYDARRGNELVIRVLVALEKRTRYDGPFATRLVSFVRKATETNNKGSPANV